MSEDIPPFHYEPLRSGEIRLLTPVASDSQRPQWRLQTAGLRDLKALGNEGFEALSYTWGDPSETFPLICNDQKLLIHKNLHDALPFLARRRSSQPLWIDAICINQRDEAEKLAQVRLMHRIYRQATKVWVWLGHSTERTDAAIAVLPRLAHLGQILQHNPPARWSDSSAILESASLPDNQSPIWDAVGSILCNDWFTRVWTVQEFALAQNVSFLCGRYEIESEQVTDALLNAHRLEGLRDCEGRSLPLQGVSQNVGMARMQRIIRRERIETAASSVRHSPGHLIGTVSSMTRDHKCREPKDRIWGVFGFLEEQQVAEVDLQDSMDVCDLYTTFSQYLFRHADRTKDPFWRLLDRGTLDGKRSGLPSWCPDFHQQIDEQIRNSICQLRSRGRLPYCASRTASFVARGQDSNQLVVRATMFDTVKRVFPITPLPPISIRQFSSQSLDSALVIKVVFDLQGLFSTILGEPDYESTLKKPGQNDETIECCSRNMEDLWRTLVGNITTQSDYEITVQTFSEFLTSINDFLALADTASTTETMRTLLSPGTTFMQFLGPLWMCLQNRRLFRTAQSRWGFGSIHIEEDDDVCIISGSTTAHILRPVGHAFQKHFHFLGEAYVHGMMNGEMDTLGLEERDITLV